MKNLSLASKKLLLKVFDSLEDGFHHPSGYFIKIKNIDIPIIIELFDNDLIKVINKNNVSATKNDIQKLSSAYLSLSNKGIEKVDQLLS